MTTQPSAAELAKLEEELDPEMQFRKVPHGTALLIGALLLALSAFHYYTAGFGLMRETTHRGIHLAFVLGLIFLVFSGRKSDAGTVHPSTMLRPGGVPIHDWLFAVAVAVASLYVPYVFEDLVFRVGNPSTLDVVMGSITIILMIEATRRAIGWGLPLIALFAIVYAIFGTWFPGIFLHPGATWSNLVNHLYLTSQGVYGVALGVVATYVFHFVLFGVLATRVGLGRLFLGVAAAVAGRFAGGPAKVSIFGSALFGMISGSSVANTVTVGSLTIPMMIRLGYQRHFAAAVESTAATGGQITPPIMGAAAFLMVEFLNLPYATIVIAAIIPACMHFFGVLMQVHFEAKRNGMRGMTDAEAPNLREVFARDWPTLAPLFGLIVVLFTGYTPYLAAFWGITGCMLVGLAHYRAGAALVFALAIGVAAPTELLRVPGVNLGLTLAAFAVMFHGVLLRSEEGRRRVNDMVDAFVLGAKYAIGVGAAAATVGIIVGVVTLTGVGFKISWIVTSLADQWANGLLGLVPFLPFDIKSATLFFTLLLTGVVCILLGCGVPTTANYIIMVTVAAPALGMLGVNPLVAHFFVFYYGVLADVTPPVAIAAYAGASMAGADPFKTGNTAFRLALGKVLVPFVFVFSPSMLIMAPGFTWTELIGSTASCFASITLLSAAFAGWLLAPLAMWERWLLALAALPMILATPMSVGAGLAIAAPVLLRQLLARRAAVAPA
ncbi:TRAP transporter permease [Bosea sp. (in: a-proteobacteria)]|uniref:TRAP transporter permease n=1 Tax=Bosea sp. (in: a-proteobacteria) TaxID=1871050 RepID=UPI001AC26A96|nr:TRAP transporter permease [Bosea sp. (in: a-proteobacteria)]MBN9438819.1 TRAP transporter permease [Bosea sp. (in: a-proteobacteria)]